MSGYGAFAKYYDALTDNVDYAARAAYFDGLLRRYGANGGLVLDLACGTGTMTRALAARGYDMIGVDASEDMLAAAMGKRGDGESSILFLCQRAEELDLYGTIDACVCALDSLNHLPGEQALRRAVGRVSLFLNPGGVFVFDMNSPYKHRAVLGDNVFVYERDEVFCVWRNEYCPQGGRVTITLDFFAREASGKYARETETFAEYSYEPGVVRDILAACGLRLKAVLEGDTLEPAGPETERFVFVTVKETAEGNGQG